MRYMASPSTQKIAFAPIITTVCFFSFWLGIKYCKISFGNFIDCYQHMLIWGGGSVFLTTLKLEYLQMHHSDLGLRPALDPLVSPLNQH